MTALIEQVRERRLVRRMALGEPQAFEEFVERYGAPLRRLARAHARTDDDADDLTQDIMIAIARGIAGFRGEAGLKTWATRIALNHCLKHRERRGVPPQPLETIAELADSADGPARSALRRELSDQVNEAVSRLSEDHRQVVVLHELQGLTYAECAGVLGIPIGTVKSRLSNSFRRLRVSLGGAMAGEEGFVVGDAQQGCANPAATVTER